MSTMTFAKIAAAALVSGALGMAGLGVGAGIASADPGHGHGHGNGGWNWDDNDGGNWRGPNYGPGYYGAPAGCIGASGPFGYVSGSLCI